MKAVQISARIDPVLKRAVETKVSGGPRPRWLLWQKIRGRAAAGSSSAMR